MWAHGTLRQPHKGTGEARLPLYAVANWIDRVGSRVVLVPVAAMSRTVGVKGSVSLGGGRVVLELRF